MKNYSIKLKIFCKEYHISTLGSFNGSIFSIDKNALVTGGAGFIGSHVVDKLIINDVRVNVLDNLSTGRLENLSKSMNSNKFRLIKGDLNNSENVKNSLQDVKTVFHMAAHPEVRTGL